MPEKWKKYKLSEITEYIGRGISPKYTEVDGIPVINQRCIRENKIIYGSCRFHNINKKKIADFKFLKKFDVLVNSTGVGTLGRVAQYKKEIGEISVDSHVSIVRPKQDFADEFFGYAIIANEKRIEALGEGSTGQTELSRIRLGEDIKLKIPESKNERESIASILSALNDKIELNLQMNKTLEEMAMALYKHWFVDFGPFQEGEFVASELGEIPKGWEVRTIGELYNTTSGGTPSRKKPEYYNDGDINWVKSKELYGNFVIDTEEKINHLGLKKSSAKLIPPKSVLLAMYGATVGESSILSIEATCNQAICAILEKELSFIYVFLYLRIFKTDILNQATGSAQQNISQQIIKNISIVSPPVGLKVIDELEQYYALIEQNVFENQTLTQLRDTLLPKLISGEVRVKDAEKTLSEVLWHN